MPPSPLAPIFRQNERAAAWINAALVSVMLVCAAAPFIELLQRTFPAVPMMGMGLLCLLLALEANLSARLFARLIFPSADWIFAHGSEFILSVFILKLTLTLPLGFGMFWQALAHLGLFFDTPFLAASALLAAVWGAATHFAGLTRELEGDEVLLEPDSVHDSNRGAVRAQLMEHIWLIGGLMVVAALVVRNDFNLTVLFTAPRPLALASTLLYFVLALVLLSLTQLAVLRARWSLERAALRENLAWRWARASLLLLLLVGAGVSVLPTRYSLGLMELIRAAVQSFILVLWRVGALLVSFFIAIMAALARWLGLVPIRGTVPPPPPPPPTPLPGGELAPPLTMWLEWETLKSLVFWGVLILMVSYGVWTYLQQRPTLLRRFRGWTWLTRWWQKAHGQVRAWQHTARVAWEQWRLAQRPAESSAWNYLGLGRLSPTAQVRFYYLALVRRAAEWGRPRSPAQTPREYQQQLAATLPEAQADLDALTESFIEARYSPHPIAPPQARTARTAWEKLRGLFNRKV